MTFLDFFWAPTATTNTTATITQVASTTTTVLNVSPTPFKSFLTNDSFWHVLQLLSLPLVWYLAYRRQKQLSLQQQKKLIENVEGEWDEPWLTDSWDTLFGLIGLANDNKWTHTPFWFYKSIHKAWHQHNRPWMKRLLSRGIIPLYISDGGIDTWHTNRTTWGRKRTFPYFTWPRYVQGTKRAVFEFLMPYPGDAADRRAFLKSIVANRTGDGEELVSRSYRTREGSALPVNDNSYGVSLRFGPPDQGPIYYSVTNPPELEQQPFIVGAESAFEWLLPFLPDTVLKKGFGERTNRLAQFCKNNQPERVPLLRYADTVIVRLEARNYDVCELDRFVYHVAQDAGLGANWPKSRCRTAARQELRRCKLPLHGLKPSRATQP
jgi:hypothetical protein